MNSDITYKRLKHLIQIVITVILICTYFYILTQKHIFRKYILSNIPNHLDNKYLYEIHM